MYIHVHMCAYTVYVYIWLKHSYLMKQKPHETVSV